jgi:Na+/melibiose symporter-like transporter
MDLSSEMIHGLLPFFLVTVLKTSALTFGVIEGVAEASTAITKLFSGVVSDWWGKRKPLLLVGYGLAALVRPVFSIALARASVARRVMLWLPTLRRPTGAVPPTGCASPWIAWAPSRDR